MGHQIDSPWLCGWDERAERGGEKRGNCEDNATDNKTEREGKDRYVEE